MNGRSQSPFPIPRIFVHFLVRSFALFINRTRNYMEWHQVFTKSITDVDYYKSAFMCQILNLTTSQREAKGAALLTGESFDIVMSCDPMFPRISE